MRNLLNLDLEEFNEIERIMHNDNLAKEKIFRNLQETTKLELDPGEKEFSIYLQNNPGVAELKSFNIKQLLELTEDEHCPRVIQDTAQEMHDSFQIKEKDRFDELFLTITGSNNCHAMKIKFLYSLGQISAGLGWLTIERKKTLENKIRFYQNLYAAHNPRPIKKLLIKPAEETAVQLSKKELKPIVEVTKVKAAPDKKSKEQVELSTEEKQLGKLAEDLIQSFGLHYELITSIFNQLLDYLPVNIKKTVAAALDSHSLLHHKLYEETIQALDKKENDLTSLLKEVHDKATKNPRSLYQWFTNILKYKNSKNIQEVFKFLNPESQNELTTLIKILKVNNKENILENSIKKEHELLNTMNNALNFKQWKKLDHRNSKQLQNFKTLLLNINYPDLSAEELKKAEKTQLEPLEKNTPLIEESKQKAIKTPENELSKPKEKLDVSKARYTILAENLNKTIHGFSTSMTSKQDSVKRLKNKYMDDINDNLFLPLGKNDENILKFCQENKKEILHTFKLIIAAKTSNDFKNITQALVICLKNNIFSKEDLKNS